MNLPSMKLLLSTMGLFSSHCRAFTFTKKVSLLRNNISRPCTTRTIDTNFPRLKPWQTIVPSSGANIHCVGMIPASTFQQNRLFFTQVIRARTTQMYGTQKNEDDAAGADFEPTWTYVPYQTPKKKPIRRNNGQRRNFSSNNDKWVVPNKVTIPEDQIEFSFARSSGKGGQNVNKVNTQVVVRFMVMEAAWIPHEVRQRIENNEANRINKEGYLVIHSQEHRTQTQNRKTALEKLQDIILKAYPRPKVRKMRKGISKKAKEQNKENKRRKSEVKKNRRRVDF